MYFSSSIYTVSGRAKTLANIRLHMFILYTLQYVQIQGQHMRCRIGGIADNYMARIVLYEMKI
jgi:hypothetical protein